MSDDNRNVVGPDTLYQLRKLTGDPRMTCRQLAIGDTELVYEGLTSHGRLELLRIVQTDFMWSDQVEDAIAAKLALLASIYERYLRDGSLSDADWAYLTDTPEQSEV